MNRRAFISALGASAAAWPRAARAQQPALPLVGFLGTSTANTPPLVGFRRGLAEAGFVEGRNVAVEYRYSEGRYDRLPALVAELLGRNVAVLFAAGGVQTALAAKPASASVPVVFANGSDPLRFGLVESFFTATLEAKRLGLLSQLVPAAAGFGVLANPANANAESQRQDVEQGGRALARPVDIVDARNEREIEAAFATLAQRRTAALLVASDPFFFSRREQIVALAARYRLPAIYEWREFAEAGGLASYGTNLVDAFRFAGMYVGRILKGEKAADLPVVQSSKFELVLNLRTARALGIEVPLGLSAAADEIFE
jgi:ABC-type uncharacterized transport system substrate-binding protein